MSSPPVLPELRTSSSSWFNSTPPTSTPPTPPAAHSAQMDAARYGTVPGNGRKERARLSKGVFDSSDAVNVVAGTDRERRDGADDELRGVHGLRKEDESWIISLAESRTTSTRQSKNPRKKVSRRPAPPAPSSALLSANSSIRSSQPWRSFFKVGSDDLESRRLERRIKRARSDIGSRLSTTIETVPPVPPLKGSEDVVRKEASAGEASTSTLASSTATGETTATTAESSSIDDMLVDTTNVQHLSLDNLANEKGFASERDEEELGEEADEGQRRAASTAEMTDSSELFEIPSRPHTTDGGAVEEGRRTSRTIEMPLTASPKTKRKESALTINDFECMRVLGKGCAGKVLLVKNKESGALYALKAIHKHHVLAHRELDHTRTEQAVLKRCSKDQSNPFVVRLHYSFHDKETLYLALDFHPGGDLATQLARWGRLGRDRTRFYCAEIVEGVEGLHRAGVIYRDLKPENILISEAGHVVLTDFGLSKDFGHSNIPPSSAEGRPDASLSSSEGAPPAPRPHWLTTAPGGRSVSTPPTAWLAGRRETTMTFCGTAEYLAPDELFSLWVLLGEPYSYEVDSWSLGTMLYEMLAGVTPFWSEDHSTMYRRVLHEELSFDDQVRVFDEDTKSLLRGLLQRNPLLRMTDSRIKKHPYFAMIEWPHRYVPPFIPNLNPLDPTDTSQFDDTYTSQQPTVENENPPDAPGAERDEPEGPPQPAFDDSGRDVFDGYSYFGGRDADSIVCASDDEDEAELGSIDVDHQEDEAGDTSLADTSMATDLTSTSFASDSTMATSAAGSPEVTLHRQPSTVLHSVVEGPSSTESVNVDEDHDSDWDVVETEVGGEARNGGKGTTLWARGVKDRYRLLVSGTGTPKIPSRGTSPFRPSPPKSASSGRRKESSGSAQSSPSPSITPEPRTPLRRLASVRSANSSKAALKTSRSDRSLTENRQQARSRRNADTSSVEGTPKKAGHTIKRLASAFLPVPKER
ncbi:protein serine/threonine kinase [Pseudohyphozyma bogoriensis]|nr:protein serine/threonine kinase [Pseudohyphozyma bogoriensis]